MPESVPESAPFPAAQAGSRRARHVRACEIPFRNIGRNMMLFAAVDAAISLLLPWMVTSSGSVNAFGLGSVPWRVLGLPWAAWAARAVWFVPVAAAVAVAAALVDRRRPTGMLLPYVSLAAGGWVGLLAGR